MQRRRDWVLPDAPRSPSAGGGSDRPGEFHGSQVRSTELATRGFVYSKEIGRCRTANSGGVRPLLRHAPEKLLRLQGHSGPPRYSISLYRMELPCR